MLTINYLSLRTLARASACRLAPQIFNFQRSRVFSQINYKARTYILLVAKNWQNCTVHVLFFFVAKITDVIILKFRRHASLALSADSVRTINMHGARAPQKKYSEIRQTTNSSRKSKKFDFILTILIRSYARRAHMTSKRRARASSLLPNLKSKKVWLRGAEVEADVDRILWYARLLYLKQYLYQVTASTD